MNVSLFQAAAALDANTRWQQMIADNLAAGAIPGFKKQDVAFSSIMAGVAEPGANTPAQTHFLLPSAGFVTDHSQGMLRPTGVNTDVALSGPGYFSIELDPENPDLIAYTRNGEFRIDLTGRLITKQGLNVLGEDGPIQTNPANPAPISISNTGEVSQGDAMLGRLRLADFADPAQLERLGQGYFLPVANAEPLPTDSEVAQTFLEEANTLPAQEMSHLILSLRHFEANQKVIQGHDERMGRAIQELAATT